MAATSPPMTSVAAAALVLTPSPALNRISFPFSRRHCRSAAPPPRWRPTRCRGKPGVTEVVAEKETSPDGEEEEVRGRGWFMVDEIGMDILTIALPAVLALAANPITALVDTAFVGHVGSTELAAVGVSISIFNLVCKLLNVPLLNVTTSFVAEQQAVDAAERNEISIPQEKASEQRRFLPAVSTSLALAAGIGLMETVALILGSGTLMDIVGIPVDSAMRVPAEQFLTLRAYGAPPVIVALAAQGTFRGFMDTKTPLFAVGVGSLVNALLDAIFIFPLGLGVSGAALATVTSEYLTAFILLWKLNNKIVLLSWNIIGGDVVRYLKSGALLIARTIAVVLTFTLSTSLAAREGSVPMAGYEICLQVWLTISLLNDALALAGQALLASEYAKGNYKKARVVLYRVLQIGGITGVALATILFLGFGYLSLLFTDDPAVLDVAQTGVWFVTVSQPINAVAFVADGLYYGVSDFAFAAYSTLFAGAVSSAVLLVAAPKFGLGGIWAGLALFMSLRAIAGLWRLGSKDHKDTQHEQESYGPIVSGGPISSKDRAGVGGRAAEAQPSRKNIRKERLRPEGDDDEGIKGFGIGIGEGKMPCLNVSTNVNLDGVDTSAVLADASKTVATIIGKPEAYVMVVLKGSVPMAFGGTQEPAAYGELVSIGGLNPDVNKKLSAGIASILESKLSIPKGRFYLKFYDSKRSDFGWNGTTF
uniref:Protein DETOXIFICATION n=1 Tax=Oryza glumipatula TaxID=40148 RepID=A0A0E0BEH1_9ORYZ